MESTHLAESSARQRRMITVTVMLASILQSLDNTIANVAMPKMQGALSATQDQVSWVLTSYIVAAAIMTPMTGWLAGRFGRKTLFLVSVFGFTVASALCGLAQGLTEMVLFRFIQGLAGAALVPMSQAVLLDINPPERHGRAMAIWGQGVLVGPMLGPILGGWLTDHYSWRWVFYINVPLGVLAFIGVFVFFPRAVRYHARLDFLGFALLSLAVASLQLCLDRGPTQDWFSATEIRFEAGVAALAFYLFIVHSLTAAQPFIRLRLFRDRNFVTGNVFIFLVGVIIFATLALLPPLLQDLLAYPVYNAGLLTAPRGLGTLIAMAVAGRLVDHLDPRWLIGGGFACAAASLWQMTHFDLAMGAAPVFWSGLLQGLGTGLAYVPLVTLSFATLAADLRNEGSAFFSLVRNIGSSIGISVVQALMVRNTQIVHASLTRAASRYAAHASSTLAGLGDPLLRARFNVEVTHQALMIAYIDDFWLMFGLSLLAMPLLLLLRPARRGAAGPSIALE